MSLIRSAPDPPLHSAECPAHGADHCAQRTRLSNTSRASARLLTCRPGDQLVARFVPEGHRSGDT